MDLDLHPILGVQHNPKLAHRQTGITLGAERQGWLKALLSALGPLIVCLAGVFLPFPCAVYPNGMHATLVRFSLQ